MLNKEVCKRCKGLERFKSFNKWWEDHRITCDYVVDTILFNGEVLERHIIGDGERNIPEECKYKLEHLVMKDAE